jgi:hypothetical protein
MSYKDEVEIHHISSFEPCSTFGKCHPPSPAPSTNPAGNDGRCTDLDCVEFVSETPEGLLLLTVNATPGARPKPFLFAEVLPSNKRSDRVKRKSRALRTPERLYIKMTMKVATEAVWCVLAPKPVIQRTTLRGRTITEYTSG